MQLWVKIIIALILGVIVGTLLGEHGKLFEPIGTLFFKLINMVIVLLVLSSMTVGITNIHDPKKLGRVGLQTLLLYMTTTAIAVALGLFLGKLFEPGAGLHLVPSESIVLKETPSIRQMLLDIVPSNPIHALAEGNVLQIIVFSFFLGVAINFAGEKGRPLHHFLESLADTMFRMTSIIMEFSPYGVFAIMVSVAGTFGLAVLLPLLKFLGVYYLACLIHGVVVFCGMLYFLARLDPIQFFKGMRDAMSMAFSTCSSSATLPVTMHCVHHNLGVSKSMTNFVLPLGASVNTNGGAIFQSMAAVFVSQAYGIHLDLTSLATLVITATLSAIGAAGVPGSGFIMLTMVFTSVGLPIEGLAILAGIDRIREMASTVMNVLGDAVCAVYVAKREGELDERRYNHQELVELQSEL